MSNQVTPFRDLKIDDIRKLIDEGYEVVDVREDWEWNKGHLPGARHVVLNSILANPTANKFRDRTIFVCAVGERSAVAAEMAVALGCRMAADVMADVRDHLLTLPGVKDAGVDIVYEPVWTPERMSEEARWELGMV